MPRADLDRVDAHIAGNLELWLGELAELCAQPSVSARHQGIEECARMVAGILGRRGFEVSVTPSAGHPVVLATRAGTAPGDRHLLCYNHYDVQPPDPLEEWTSPPFEPTRREGALFARGAKDDKGDFMARVAAVDTLLEVTGGLPCRITFLVEGEEEIGSPSLPGWVEEHRGALGAQAAIWEEGGIDEEGRCQLALGARGLLYVQLEVRTMTADAHSGGANLVPNAAWRLLWALAGLKGADERVLIDGFYDSARQPTAREEALVAQLPSQEESLRRELGLARLLLNRTGTETRRAVWEPTCNVAGLGSGYQGEGSKTIVPARAMAKLDFRLVPDQDPHDIALKLRGHLDRAGFDDVEMQILGAEPAGLTDPDDPFVRLAAEAAEEVYGVPACLIPLNGGTTPKFLFTRQNVPVVAPGVGYPGSKVHSPDENVRLRDFELATRHLVRVIDRFAHGGDS